MKHNDGACEACRAELRPNNGSGSQNGGSFVLHTLAAATLATSLTILGTAGDLGPFAPMLIAVGLYLAVFGMLIYLGLAGRALVRAMTRKRSCRTSELAEPHGSTTLLRGRT
jgi:hypothetical protein